MPPLTKSQIDKLGRRLTADGSDIDRQTFYDYRAQFGSALEAVKGQLETLFPGTKPVGRLKTLDSVVAKIQREHTRLSTMQDIAGCRIVIPGVKDQYEAVAKIRAAFPTTRVHDLLASPHHGYRAMHVIGRSPGGLAVEIQVRTQLQDQWAQLSEKLADRYGIELKYGGGPQDKRAVLVYFSRLGGAIEAYIATAQYYVENTQLFEEELAELLSADAPPNESKKDLLNALSRTRSEIDRILAIAEVMRLLLLQAMRTWAD